MDDDTKNTNFIDYIYIYKYVRGEIGKIDLESDFFLQIGAREASKRNRSMRDCVPANRI